mmetsp:Transcript_23209/g.39295  ORF Transcript_23209/g.39295 Transcript_23209/m.39295 type:complete len:609 (+) Transcript_23209:131-1957(+)
MNASTATTAGAGAVAGTNFPPPVITVRVDSSMSHVPLPLQLSLQAQSHTNLPLSSGCESSRATHVNQDRDENNSTATPETSAAGTHPLLTAPVPAAVPVAASVPSTQYQGGVKRDITSRMEKAVAIADRYDMRGQILPRYLHKVSGAHDPSRVQEYKDADKLKYWRNALAAENFSQCPLSLAEYLDQRMAGWRDIRPTGKAVSLEEQLSQARGIVERCRLRGGTLPRELREHRDNTREEEYRDAQKLSKWKQGLKGSKHGHACAPEVKAFLDAELPGWHKGVNSKGETASAVQMEKARAIVARYQARGEILPRNLSNRTTPEEIQEHRDAQKLNDWKQALVKEHRGNCPQDLQRYLDEHMPVWRRYINSGKGVASDHQMNMAREVVARFQAAGGRAFPRQWKDRSTPEKSQEYKDAIRLSNWKKLGARLKAAGSGGANDISSSQTARKDSPPTSEAGVGVHAAGRGHSVADVLEYLDSNMPGWRNGPREFKSKTTATSVKHSARALLSADTAPRTVTAEVSVDSSQEGDSGTASVSSQGALKRPREVLAEPRQLQGQTLEGTTIKNNDSQTDVSEQGQPAGDTTLPAVRQLPGVEPQTQSPATKVARI